VLADRSGAISCAEFLSFLDRNDRLPGEAERLAAEQAAAEQARSELTAGQHGRRLDGREHDYERAWVQQQQQPGRPAARLPPPPRRNVVAANARRGAAAAAAATAAARRRRQQQQRGRGAGGGGTIRMSYSSPRGVRQMARAEALAVLGL
jgi:hypothetical protein